MKKPKFLDRLANRLGYYKEISIAPLSNRNVPVPPSYKQYDYLKAYSGWVYACVRARATDAARINLRLYRTINAVDGEVEEVLEHNVLSLFRRVNPWMTKRQLFEHTQSYRDLAGEAFWLLVRGGKDRKGEILEIWMLRPDWISVIPDETRLVRGYKYTVPGFAPIEFRTDEIIHFKEFNPIDPYRGLSIVGAAAVTIDSEAYAENYNKKFFQNSATPSAVLKTEQKLDPKLKEKMRVEWDGEYGGPNKAHRTAILEAGLELQPFSVSQKDMEFLQGQQYNRDKIMALFQTPKTILGMTEDVTVSNAEATDFVFQKRVILPLMEKIRDDLNEFLLPLYDDLEDCFFDFDSPVPELLDNDVKRYNTLFSLGAMTPNEIRQDQGLDEVPGLDQFYIPYNLLAISSEDATTAPAPTPAEGDVPAKGTTRKVKKFKGTIPPPRLKDKIRKEIEEKVRKDIDPAVRSIVVDQIRLTQKVKAATDQSETIGTSKISEDAQDQYWKGFVAKAEGVERQYEKTIRDIMGRQESEIIDRLKTVRKIYAAKDSASDIQKILFSISKENKTSATLVVPIISGLIEDAGDEALNLIGSQQTIDTNSAIIRHYLTGEGLRGIQSMNSTTRNALKVLLAQSFAEGLSNDQTARKINEYFGGIGKVRAQAIARTETIKASNFGALEAYKQSGVVVGKQWYTALDERVCPQCAPLQGIVLGLDQNFYDKGDTQTGSDGQQYKLDFADTPTPPLHVNCRCTIIPITRY